MKFTNKIALVTGGATGVGRAVCMDLARQGATVVLNYGHSNSAAWETVGMIQSCGGKVVAMKADVSDDGAVKEMIRNVEKEFGALHYLVNNAGITRHIELPDLEGVTDEIWDQLFAVNVKGMFYCARAAAPLMKRQKGSAILNVGSVAGITGSGSSLPYAVSKAAVHGLTKSLARALAPEIRVNCIAPAAILTPWWQGKEDKMHRLNGDLPLERVSTPEDIAGLICCLLPQESLTGQIISPNNGMVI